MPVKAAPGYLASTGPGVWVKAVGSWTNRSDTSEPMSNLIGPAGAALPAFDLSYRQNTYAVMGGFDAGRQALLLPSDTVVVGVMGGYLDSSVNFKTSPTSFNYTGGTVGVSGTYLNRGWFADALMKADFLRLGLNFPTLAGFGFDGTTVDATNVGGLVNAGYRFNFRAAYLEPIGTLGYVQTHIDGFNALGGNGTNVSFNNGESFRGAIGARVGTMMWSGPVYKVDAAITGKVWDEFASRTGVVLNTTGSTLTLDDPRGRTFGEVAGLIDIGNIASNWSGFVDTSVKFNNEFTTITAKGGVRKQW